MTRQHYAVKMQAQIDEQARAIDIAKETLNDIRRYLNSPKFNNPQAAGDLLHYVNINDVLPMLAIVTRDLDL